MARESSGAGYDEPPVPPHYIIDQDTTDEYLDGPPVAYQSGSTPEQRGARVDEIIAEAKAGKRTLPEPPEISDG